MRKKQLCLLLACLLAVCFACLALAEPLDTDLPHFTVQWTSESYQPGDVMGACK